MKRKNPAPPTTSNIHAPLLTAIRTLIPLSEAEEEIVCQLFKEKHYKKGSFFLAENEICRQAAFVISGFMRYYINDDGEEKTYGFAKPFNFACNYESFVPQNPSSQIIQALEDCVLLTISYDDLLRFYEQVRYGDRFGRLVIEQVFIQTLKDRNSFYTDSPEGRYEQFIREHKDLLQQISQYHIASFVGIKPQSLSRIRKRLARN
ncbi:Crp/Fnr family transcriptional regulator [Chitinophaga pinensis]|uniref:Crp/Fnr family transcriptional regulator n=1 Tax=Chitinophaga pinensis TaxID=79329 RepID=A0A5C6LR65_9BACT|nr:Crp/Fnr family transcriptional regulator [Chitinophaga pinensis]TWV99113.1 Crp/Fnr family transcriptional regulator [Chitinophaga pinensis]